jgi:hypothetical protein
MLALDTITRPQRAFSAFAKLCETTDCAGQKGETNQQEGNPEAACVTEPIADSELDVEIGQNGHDKQESGSEHHSRISSRPLIPCHNKLSRRLMVPPRQRLRYDRMPFVWGDSSARVQKSNPVPNPASENTAS